jgi:hypothetical protein
MARAAPRLCSRHSCRKPPPFPAHDAGNRTRPDRGEPGVMLEPPYGSIKLEPTKTTTSEAGEAGLEKSVESGSRDLQHRPHLTGP